MRLTFLGTSAAEGLPAVFCNCDACRRAKARGGKDVRTRSQILIDDDTLFDFPMDTYMHMLKYGLDLSAVRRVLITHAHMDHCYPQEFCMRGAPFAYGLKERTVDIFCDPTVKDIFLADTSREMRPEIASGIRLNVMHPFEGAESGDMTIIALPANHTKGEECLVYYVRRGGKGALLLNDTGRLSIEVYERLKEMGGAVDAVTFDCTYGASKSGSGRHMGLPDIAEQIELLEKAGVCNGGVSYIATHFSHNTALDHDGLVNAAAPYGVTVAYDGFYVDF